MSEEPERPSDWRDLLNKNYDYPDELLANESGRQRRRGKRQWRKADRERRAEWIRERRRDQEPLGPGVIFGAVVVVVLLVFSVGYFVPKWFHGVGGDGGEGDGITLLKPTEGAAGATSHRSPAPTSSHSVSPPPSTPAQLSTRRVNATIAAWAKEFYTRRPATETYSALVDRMQPYLTAEVSESLKEAGDLTYEALAADGAVSHVGRITITAPPATGGAPADTTTRATRLLIARITTTGKKPDQFDLRALITVVPDRGTWRISAIAGETG